LTEVSAGRVGRAHGRDGSFYVEGAEHPLPVGTVVRIAGTEHRIERRAGTDARPLIRIDGIEDRESAAALSKEIVLIDQADAPLEEGEWLVSDLVGCEIEGLGYVERVVGGSSCDVLEVGRDGVLVPLVSDAIKRIDLETRVIEINREFLGL
jgi:16S rRNA processing protein RimM